MTENANRVDTFRAVLVLAATVGTIAFNWLAAAGRINGVTPDIIAAKYPTPITPADYAFTIWSLIYVGMLAFSVYQLLPANAARFRGIRSYYILSCALNCGWIYMWHHDQIVVCFAIILLLLASLFLLNLNLKRTTSLGEYWFAKAPFGLYMGWVSVAAVLNFAVMLVYWNVSLSASAWMWLSIGLILFAGLLAVLIRVRLSNYLYPLAIAWGLAAIGVKQSGQTLIVVACAAGLVAGLIASMSFVVNLPSSDNRQSNE